MKLKIACCIQQCKCFVTAFLFVPQDPTPILLRISELRKRSLSKPIRLTASMGNASPSRIKMVQIVLRTYNSSFCTFARTGSLFSHKFDINQTIIMKSKRGKSLFAWFTHHVVYRLPPPLASRSIPTPILPLVPAWLIHLSHPRVPPNEWALWKDVNYFERFCSRLPYLANHDIFLAVSRKNRTKIYVLWAIKS